MIVNLTKKIDFCNRKIEVIVSENRTHKLGVIWNQREVPTKLYNCGNVLS